MEAILMSVITVSALIVGYVIGKYKERIKWNILIQRGIIPEPKK
jgi:hypothetical protein